MKRKLIVFCLVAALALGAMCLTACDDKLANQLHTINVLMRAEHSYTKLSVSTTNGGVTLNAQYTLTKQGDSTNVAYEIEQLSEFGVNGDTVTIPNGFKTNVTGTAVYNNGSIVSVDGVTISPQVIQDVMDLTVMFRVPYFKNVLSTKTSFKAEVTDPQGFMNNDSFDATDMNVYVTYTSKSIVSLTIDYTTSGGVAVKLDYAFAL